MAVTNLLKQQVDQPVFEWARPAPTATSATSALASSDDQYRYMYYVVGQALWRYDTYSDSWQECAPPPTAPVTTASLKFSKYSGYRGHTIAATSNTITVAGFSKHSHIPDNVKIRIVSGTGAGQERTITEIADAVVADFGVVTSASATAIGDSTKKWRVNQWDGYQCRLVYSTGQSQIRRILYNDTTTLTFADANFQAIDSFNNTGFSAVAPYAAPVTTAGSQTHYLIESSVLTVDSPWDVVPDESSVYIIVSGALWLFSSAAASPFATLQFYDILTDSWMTKTGIGGLITAAYGTDFAIDRTGEVAGAFVSGLTATSGGEKSLINAGATMTYDRWANHQLRIMNGKGVGQRRRIVGNTDTTFFIDEKWGITLDNTSGYAVYPDTDKIWAYGNASSALWQYSVERDIWSPSHIVNGGIARNISFTPSCGTGLTYEAPHEGFAGTIVYNANGILTVAVNNGGTNYVVGDLVTLSTTGSGAQAYVTSVGANGAVTGLQLAASGTNYTSVTTSNTTGGSGSSLTINVTVGKVGNVTIVTNHDFRHNDYVKIAGCATDTTFNGTFQIIGVGSLTTFSIANPSGSASPTAANSQSTSILVDASQNWNTNSHTGRILYILSSGAAPTLVAARKIASNTATTITVSGSSITTPTNGQSRYIIAEPRGFGAMCTTKIAAENSFGWATSGSATTLVDSTKNWRNNQWINCRVRVICGTGEGNESVITGNTATTLTVASWGVATPDSTSKYEILDSFGVVTTGGSAVTTITDANKNYGTNALAGKRIRITAGAGIGIELAIVSNTATVITAASTLTTEALAANGSFYTIYEPPARSTGTDIKWLFGLTDPNQKGRWLLSPRGGASNCFDIYDIPSNTWELTPFITPITATLTTGSMYAYDGGDVYYFTKDATGRVYALNLDTFKVDAATTTPHSHGAAVIGNRMEIVSTSDGLKYMYIMRHSGQEMWRTLKFW
jgi:hypothetical protein